MVQRESFAAFSNIKSAYLSARGRKFKRIGDDEHGAGQLYKFRCNLLEVFGTEQICSASVLHEERVAQRARRKSINLCGPLSACAVVVVPRFTALLRAPRQGFPTSIGSFDVHQVGWGGGRTRGAGAGWRTHAFCCGSGAP